jgi:hypothetical protein
MVGLIGHCPNLFRRKSFGVGLPQTLPRTAKGHGSNRMLRFNAFTRVGSYFCIPDFGRFFPLTRASGIARGLTAMLTKNLPQSVIHINNVPELRV